MIKRQQHHSIIYIETAYYNWERITELLWLHQRYYRCSCCIFFVWVWAYMEKEITYVLQQLYYLQRMWFHPCQLLTVDGVQMCNFGISDVYITSDRVLFDLLRNERVSRKWTNNNALSELYSSNIIFKLITFWLITKGHLQHLDILAIIKQTK
jgi:hypothetical protein